MSNQSSRVGGSGGGPPTAQTLKDYGGSSSVLTSVRTNKMTMGQFVDAKGLPVPVQWHQE